MTGTDPLDAIAGGRAAFKSNIPPYTPDETKNTVRRLDPNGGRCLLLNVLPHVECCHLFPRKRWKDSRVLSTLELLWGLIHESLDVNSVYNMILLQPSYHKFFDASEFILVAEKAVIAKFTAKHNDRWPRFANFKPEDTWSYTVLPMPSFKHPVLLRLRGSVGETIDSTHQSTPEDHEIWDLVGEEHHVICHAHPLFVIMHAGKTLHALQATDKQAFLRYKARYPQINSILTAFRRWTVPMTQEEIDQALKDDASFAPPESTKPISAASTANPQDANDKDYSDSDKGSQSECDNPPTSTITRSRASAYASSQAPTPVESTLSASVRSSRSSQRLRGLHNSSAPSVATSDAYRPEGSSAGHANIERKGSSRASSKKRKR